MYIFIELPDKSDALGFTEYLRVITESMKLRVSLKKYIFVYKYILFKVCFYFDTRAEPLC